MCVVVGSRPLIPLMAGLHLQHVDVVAKVPELLWVVSPKVVLWSHAGGVCCMEGLLVHSLRFRQLLEGGFPVRRGAGAARPQPRNCRRAATQGSQARQLNVCCAGNRGDVRCGWAADEPAAGGGAAQIVSEERRKTRGIFS